MKHFQPPKLYQWFLYWLSKTTCLLLFKLFWRLEITGAENVPFKGGCLLASNHISLADPPLVAASLERHIHFFAKEELFKVPFLGWYIAQLNAFPVKRFEHDVGAFKRAQLLLKNGEAVLLFPEGSRSKTGELGAVKPGVGMLAYKAGVPVVPIYIHNSNQLKKFKKLKLFIGTPISPPDLENEKKGYQPFSDTVIAAVADLKSKMYNP